MTPSQGRTRIDNPKNECLFILVTPQEKEEIHAFARETGNTLLDIIKLT